MTEIEGGGAPSASPRIATVEDILEAAPKDLEEKVLHVDEWGLNVRIRSLTAAQSARIRSVGFKTNSRGNTVVDWPALEKAQFRAGVVEPKFSEDQVKKLYMTGGAGFQTVIGEIDKLSGTKQGKEDLASAEDEFQDES